MTSWLEPFWQICRRALSRPKAVRSVVAARLPVLLALAAGCEAEDAAKPASTADATADSAADSSSDTKDVAKDTAKADVQLVCKPWEKPAAWNCPDQTHCGYNEDGDVDCVPDGKHDLGALCDDGGGCKIGLCVQSKNGQSRCSPFCTIASHCASKSCVGIQGETYKVCDMAEYKTCDPFGTACPSGQSCYYMGGEGFVCLSGGEAQEGDSCKVSYDCASGLHCAGAGGLSTASGLCRSLCKVGGGAPMCESVSTPCAPISGNAGYCDQ